MGMDIHGRNPKGAIGRYLSVSVWSWAPLLKMIDAAVASHGLAFDTSRWSYNDGNGLRAQEECDRLADAIEDVISRSKRDDWQTELPANVQRFGRMFGFAVEEEGLKMERVESFLNFLRECGGFEIR